LNPQSAVLHERRRKINFLSKQIRLIKNFSIEKARKTQFCLSKKIILGDKLPAKSRTIAGVDVSYSEQLAVGAVVVLDYESLEVLETQVASSQVKIHAVQLCFPSGKFLL
jgi:hypothetical protein